MAKGLFTNIGGRKTKKVQIEFSVGYDVFTQLQDLFDNAKPCVLAESQTEGKIIELLRDSNTKGANLAWIIADLVSRQRRYLAQLAEEEKKKEKKEEEEKASNDKS